MFARLYPSLTPPTKTLAWVVTANLLLALVLLFFSFDQLHYFVQGKYVSPDDALCHNMFSLARALILFTWYVPRWQRREGRSGAGGRERGGVFMGLVT
jgi:hypothetical protein